VPLLLARARPHREPPGKARGLRPLSFATGPLWVALQFSTPLAFLLEAIVPFAVYGGPFTLGFPGDSALQVAGILAWFLGGALALWGQRELGKYTRLEIAVFGDHRLVTSGPYRWIRHPLYTALLTLIAGTGLFLLNALMLGLVPVALAIALRRALLEEELLSTGERFGEEYRSYMGRPGRFLPRSGSSGP
jgi:protein-S-isoprenylcysteine O-methyltransferase Ste14